MKRLLHILALAACTALPLRAPTANADTGTGQSGNVKVDMRNLTMTGLTVSGPTSVPWGSDAAYMATLSFAGAASQDVTMECEWSVSGGPLKVNWWELPIMHSNILSPGVPSTVPLHVSAAIKRNTGRIVSPPFSVTITESNGMNIGIALVYPSAGVGPVYVRTEGSNFVWRVAAVAYGLAADKPGVTFQWSIGSQPVGTGKNLDTEFTGMPGTRQLRVVATDPQNRVGQSYWALTFNAPPVLNEPPAMIPAIDPVFGDTLKENESVNGGTLPFGFDPLKTPNGLIVLTHGLYDNGSNAWLSLMARAIRLRLINAGKPLPNIMIFDWGDPSDPTRFFGIDAARDRAIEKAKNVLVSVPLNITSATVWTVADFILVRPVGQSEGQELAGLTHLNPAGML